MDANNAITTIAPLVKKGPRKARHLTNLKMANLPEIEVFNNVLEAVHDFKNAYRFESATFQATTKSIEKFKVELKRDNEENKKQEEKLAWLKSRNNELNNTLNGVEAAMRSTESKKCESKSLLLKSQARNEKRFNVMEKNVQLYKNKWENMYNFYESSPLAVKQTKLKNHLKNFNLHVNMLRNKLNSLKSSICKYKAINKKRLQTIVIKFAQSMTDSSKNEEKIMNKQNSINKLKQENESIISETKSISLAIEDLKKQKEDSLKEKLSVIRKENSAKVVMLGFNLPSLSFDQQNVPLLELSNTQTQITSHSNVYNKPGFDNNVLNKYDINNMNTNINKNDTENFRKEMTKETIDMEIDDTDQVNKEKLFVEVAVEKEKNLYVDKNFDEFEKDVKKRNAPKVNILSNVQLNKEQTAKILESYIHKIPSLNQHVGYVVGNNKSEINMKNHELFANMNEDENNEFPEEKSSNVFNNINPDDKAIENTNEENMNEMNQSCLDNKSEYPETQKLNPLHQEYIHVAKENIHNDSVIELQPSRSKYFEENNFNKASPPKIGFAHSTPNNKFEQHSIIEKQPETTSFNKNDLYATNNIPELIIPNDEPMQCEETPMEVSPMDTSNFNTFSTQRSPNIYVQGQKLGNDQIMALLRYGADTQQSEDTYSNYREIMRMASSYVVSPKDDDCVDFKMNEIKDKIDPCPKTEFANTAGGFFDIFKNNEIAASTAATATAASTAATATAAPTANESTPTFNFNFNNQEKKKKTFFNFF